MAPKIPINVKHNLEDIDEFRNKIWQECQAMLQTTAEAQMWAEEQHDTPNILRLSQLNRQLTRITNRLNKIERKVLDGLENRYRPDEAPEIKKRSPRAWYEQTRGTERMEPLEARL